MNQIEAGTVNQNNIGNMQTDWMHIIQSLSKIYTSVYDIDVKQNRYTELASESTIHSYIGSSGKAQERLNFFCHHMMTPAYTDEMLEFVDLSTLEERLANNRIISKQYESTVMISDMDKEAPTWRQCSFIEGDRDNDGHLAHVIFATQSIQETKIRELETQKKLQETNDELKALLETERKYTTIIGSLGSIYAAMYYVDLEDRSFQELISLDSLHPVFGEKGDARALLRKLVDLLVSEEYRPIMRLFTDLDTVDDRLGDKRIIIQEYVRALGGWTRCSFIAAQKDENGRNRKVILGLREITAEKETIEIQESLIQALSMSYENVYTVNMNTYEAICYRMGQNMSDRYGKKFAIGNYEKNIQLYIENDVYQEDRHLFAPICTVDGVSNLLSDKSTYSFHYRVFRNEQIHYYQCQLVKPRKERREFVVGFRDVDDEMRRQQKQIREMETQREIIQGLGSEYYSVLLVNPDTDTVSVYRAEDEDGRAIAQHFGKHHESWTKGVRSYAKEQVSEASRGQFLEKLSLDFIRSGKMDYSFTYEKITQEGLIYLQARVAYVRESDGRFVVVVGTRNVDDLIKKERQQEMALRAAFDVAEAANRAKTDFLSNMSHDIRTPMNGIIGMTAIAAAHLDDRDRVQDCLQKITKASKHLLSLINEVLDMSKIESGKVQLIEEEFNLSDLIDNLLAMTNSQIEAHHHSLSVNISGVTHEAVIGDSLRIQKVFTNLMGNAVKFTPDGGKIRISISEKPCSQAKVGCYEFVFEDNGIGMSEDFIDRIFEPFTRAEDGWVNKVQGTGLGMLISRNIVRMMGGDIKVESKRGVGSRFTVTMYLKLQDTQQLHYDRFIDLDVLVADDDEMSLESCCSILDELGMHAEGVSCGAEAVERVVLHHEQNRDYFACILDWKMPDMDGIAATRAIRKKVGKDVPIIIISAYDWSDIEQEARAAGVDAFISKPLFRSRLANTFRLLVGDEEQKKADLQLTDLSKMDLTGRRALLVEDNDLNAEIASEILGMTGLTVERAVDGTEAVDRMAKCEDGYYDIIFMDIQMPKMNGYDATRAIRAMNRGYCRKVPIIAMTANAFAEDVIAAKTVGMNEHIAKPFDMKILAKTLVKWVQ